MKKINKQIKQIIWSKKVMLIIVAIGALAGTGVILGLGGYFGGGEKGVPEDTWTRGLVAAYNFDEGSGDTLYNAAATGSVNDGTLMNNPTWVTGSPSAGSGSAGASGTALEFDGTDDYVSVSDSDDFSPQNGMSISAWFKTSGAGSMAIVGKYENPYEWYLSMTTDRGLLYMLKDDGGSAYIGRAETASGGSIYNDNNWHLVVATWNGGTTSASIKIYVDGAVQVDTVNYESGTFDALINSNSAVTIGSLGAAGDEFNGAIDGVKIYNRALSAEEVRYHYNRGGPVAHWGFDEGAGVNVYNSADTSAGTAGYPISAGLGNRIPAQYDGSIKSSALDFDGSDQYVNCGSDASLDNITDAITIEAWVKPVNNSGPYEILHKDDENPGSFFIRVNGGTVDFILRDTSGNPYAASPYPAITGNVWTHIAGVYDGNHMMMYVNGILGVSNTVGAFNFGNTQNLFIGKRNAVATPYYFNGSIDEVRIYNKALHATTIANHYKGDYGTYEKTAGGADLTDDDLVLYIPFDDAAGDTATNYGACGGVAANCNGTLTNYTTAEQVAKYGDSHDTGWVIDTDFVAARQNTGLDFGGVNGFFQSDSYIPAASSTSYSLWFKSSNGTYSANEYLFSQGNDDPSVYIDTSGNIKVMAEDGVLITSATTVLDTKWHHIETTADGTNMRLYIDGVLDGTAAYTGSSDDAGISAGAHISRSGFFNGIIDDLKVYNYARSPGEIRLDYNAGFATRMGPAGMTCSEDPASCMDLGLVASYDFDEGDGQVAYNAAATGSVNDGTLGSTTGSDTNDPSWVAGNQVSKENGNSVASPSGSALSFDGTDDYVDCGNDSSLDITDAITIEAWVKLNNITDSAAGIVTKDDEGTTRQFNLMQENNHFNWRIWQSDDTSNYVNSGTLTADKWYHIVGIGDGSYARLYLDGVEVGTPNSYDGTIKSLDAQEVEIGEYSDFYYFNGSIDGVKIYNRALSAEEVRYHYNRGGPVAHWRMDEGEGSIAYDESSNDNDGTLHLGSSGNTATSSAWVAGKHGSAIDFDGTDDYVPAASIPITASNSYSISLWFKSDGNSGTHMIWQGTTSSSPSLEGNDTNYRFYVNNNQNVGTGAINTGQWYHWVGTWDESAGEMRAYLDGSLLGTESDATDDNFGTLYLASRVGLAYFFNGAIDDVRIYNYARTAAQIQMDYNAGLATHFGGSNQSSVINEQCSSDPASCMDLGLVASYDFDEGDGQTLYNAADTGSANNGTLGSSSSADTADPTWVASEGGSRASASSGDPTSAAAGGSALDFDGTDDYVDCGNDSSLDITDAITIEAWVKRDVLSVEHVIASKYEHLTGHERVWYLALSTDNTVVLVLGDPNDGTSESIEKTTNTLTDTNVWHHIFFTFDSGTLKFYVDGQHWAHTTTSGTTPASLYSNNIDVLIGARNPSSIGEEFNGAIDSVKIYNRALSAEEIRYHYNRGGPVAHWRMDEGEGSIAYDESSNNNDGTLHLGSSGNTATSSAWVAGNSAAGSGGSAIDFDGTDDYIDCGNDASLNMGTGNFTTEAWFKSTGTTEQHIIGRGSGSGTNSYVMRLSAGKTYINISSSDPLINSILLNDDKWHHLALTADRIGFAKLYVDGMLDQSLDISSLSANAISNANWQIGRQTSSSTGTYFNGIIDDVRIYNYARTPAQIQMDYNAGFGAHLK